MAQAITAAPRRHRPGPWSGIFSGVPGLRPQRQPADVRAGAKPCAAAADETDAAGAEITGRSLILMGISFNSPETASASLKQARLSRQAGDPC